MKVLDGHLAEREWIAADKMTTADLSCIGYLYFTDEFGVDMAEFPRSPDGATPSRRCRGGSTST